MPAASRMKRHSAPTPESPSPPAPRPASPAAHPPRPLSPGHPSRPPHNDESDAVSLASVSSDGGAAGDNKVKAAQSFEALFNSEKLSDFLLDVNQGMYVFHAHKMIVGLKSERLAALITASTSSSNTGGGGGGGNNCTSSNCSALTTSVNNNTGCGISTSNTSTFTAGKIAVDNGKSSPGQSPTVKPTLYLHESPECGAVFGRFLYFIYSGAVWLHRDYVLPLHALSVKYGVAALASHCENYVQQLLRKCLLALDASAPSMGANQTSSSSSSSTATKTPQSVGGSLLPAAAVCDIYEAGWDMFREETRGEAFAVLSRRFPELCRGDRWAGCAWVTVRDLLRSDACACDENVMLVAATDWMKKTRLQDKARIQELLSSIRYPRLPRRVLYHLHTTASFRNFPPVQVLIEAAIRYHCFRDVPEAKDEFTGRQYRARGGGRPASRHTVCGGEHACCRTNGGSEHAACNGDMTTSAVSTSNNSGNHRASPHEIAQPNEWGCYGDPSDAPNGEGNTSSGDSINNNNNNSNNVDNQHSGMARSNSNNNNSSKTRNSPDLVSESSAPAMSNQQHLHNPQRSHRNHNQQHSNHNKAHHQHHHGCRSQHAARNNRHQNQVQQGHQHQQQQRKQHHQQQPQQHQQHNQQQHAHQCRGCYDGHQRHQGSPVAAVQPRVHTPEEDRTEALRHAGTQHDSLGASRHLEASHNAERPDYPLQPPPFTRV